MVFADPVDLDILLGSTEFASVFLQSYIILSYIILFLQNEK